MPTSLKPHQPPSTESPPPLSPGRRLLRVIGKEARELVPAWVFFGLMFSLLRWTQIAVLKQAHLRTFPAAHVLVGSLLVAKAVLVADLLPLLRRLEKESVLLGSLWKTLCYALIVFCFRYLEELVLGRHQGLARTTREFIGGMSTATFWVLQVWLVILLFMYSTARQLRIKLGPQRFRALWLER